MNQKSLSLGKLPPSPQSPSLPKISYLNYRSRLNFPINGDTLFYSHSGRKHYDNSCDRMLRIIHPRDYALNNPIQPLTRQNSLPPPHLQTHSPQISPTGSQQKSSRHNTRKPSSKSGKIQDELDRMTAQVYKQKMGAMVSRKLEKNAEDSLLIKREATFKFTLTPKISKEIASPVFESKRQNLFGSLLNPEHKTPLLVLDNSRVRNPSFLSSGLSII